MYRYTVHGLEFGIFPLLWHCTLERHRQNAHRKHISSQIQILFLSFNPIFDLFNECLKSSRAPTPSTVHGYQARVRFNWQLVSKRKTNTRDKFCVNYFYCLFAPGWNKIHDQIIIYIVRLFVGAGGSERLEYTTETKLNSFAMKECFFSSGSVALPSDRCCFISPGSMFNLMRSSQWTHTETATIHSSWVRFNFIK